MILANRSRQAWRAARLLGAVALVAVYGHTPDAVAQAAPTALCADPAAQCRAQMDDRCLDRVGAGSLPARDAACQDQARAYLACVAAAADACAPAEPQIKADAASSRCTPFVEQTLFEAALRDPARTPAFLEACPESLLRDLAPQPPTRGASGQADAATDAPLAGPGRALTLRSGQRETICAARGGVDIAIRVWRRNASTATDRATVEADSLTAEQALSTGQTLRLAQGCEVTLERTGYKGWFFAEITVRESGVD